jgi:hypothetical protein
MFLRARRHSNLIIFPVVALTQALRFHICTVLSCHWGLQLLQDEAFNTKRHVEVGSI